MILIQSKGGSIILKQTSIISNFITSQTFLEAQQSILIIDGLILYNNTFTNVSLLRIFNSYVFCSNLNFTQNSIYNQKDFLIVLSNNIYVSFEDLFFGDNKANLTLFLVKNSQIVQFNNFLIEQTIFPQFFFIESSEKVFFQNISFYKVQLTKEINDIGGIFEIFSTNFVYIEYASLIQSFSKDNIFVGFIFREITNLLINEMLIFKNFGNYSERTALNKVGIGLYVEINSNYDNVFEMQNSLFLSNLIITNIDFDGVAAPCGIFFLINTEMGISDVFFENNMSTDYGTCLVISANILSIANSLFLNNSAWMDEFLEKNTLSGTLIVDFFQFTLYNTTFVLNKANFGTCFQMKITSLYNQQIFLAQNNKFLVNYAYDCSNIFHIFSNTLSRIVKFLECDFIKGKSDGLSGLFYFGTKYGPFSQNYSFISCNFIENIGSYFGSIIEHYPTNPNNCFIIFDSCTFLSNKLLNIFDSYTCGLLIDVWGEAVSEDSTNFDIFTNKCYFSGIFFFH